ncbi:alpha/beta-Hydrolases superfamily protein [Raphanus sativus]|uniref:Triacylglycerol lipase OBL1 n=1 Tax=Raphanus sativus TaxID=3726 RepID=A0A6J0NAM1_RAPSA|nr:triacylglycerol lipase OBL1 [Raphanus sativus]KAJ4901817.1 alpha/beta-Hydrolases superfamily protein [Raphanus sativus]
MCTTEKYFVLDPREATFSDLARLLFSSDIRNRKFIDSSEQKLEDDFCRFRRRWIIFVSIVIQKLMILLRKPLYLLGFYLSFWLNLLSSNGGFFKILPKLFKGKIIWPEKTSATFASLVGNLDRRVELDRRIERGSKRYKAMLSIMASKLSYENTNFVSSVLHNHWKMDLLGFYSCWNGYQKQKSTEVIIIKDTSTYPNLIVVSFRGTDPFDADDWCTDFDLSWYEIKNVGKVHGGFMKALGLQKEGWPKVVNIDQTQNETTQYYAYYTIMHHLKNILDQNPASKFILTGHSLGGALAILFTAVLMMHDEEQMLDKLEGVYTFGQPRVGDEEFGNFMKDSLEKYEVMYERYVYCNDMVPRLPFDDKTLMFKHFGACLYYDSFYRGKVEQEEPNKNYFNVLWAIPKIMNAMWELMRSFIIPYWKGEEYREGWLLKCFRVVALLIPGLPAHAPNEYVNATLLGNLPDLHLD